MDKMNFGKNKAQHSLFYLVVYAIAITVITGVLGALYFYTPEAPGTETFYAQPPFVANEIIARQHPVYLNAIISISMTNAQNKLVTLQPTSDFDELLERLDCTEGTIAASESLDETDGYIESVDLSQNSFSVSARREFYIHLVCPYIFADEGRALSAQANLFYTTSTTKFEKKSNVVFENIILTDVSSYTQIGIIDGDAGDILDPSEVFAFCGDGTCDASETLDSCPIDCAICGDGVCSAGETTSSCPDDCTFVPQCNDGIDNDGDGLIDLDDPGCIDDLDVSELDGSAECSDGMDNDGDGFIDLLDSDCENSSDNSEGSNDLDNDGILNDVDNCLLVPNTNQLDSDQDEVGDVCDYFPDANKGMSCRGDVSGSGSVGAPDLTNVLNNFLACSVAPCLGDANGDSLVNNDDLQIVFSEWTELCATVDEDADGVFENGDGTAVVGDNFCPDGQISDCDDNCALPNGPLLGTCMGTGVACTQDAQCFSGPCNLAQEDSDADNLGDVCDNCPFDMNFDQIDTDGDGSGDACDADIDEDGLLNEDDNCPFVVNGPLGGTCTIGGSIGSECTSDADCAWQLPGSCSMNQEDLDGDGLGDACDMNTCGNGICEIEETVDSCSADCDGTPACNDGQDNDRDGQIDWGFTLDNDKNCATPNDVEQYIEETQVPFHLVPDFSLHADHDAIWRATELQPEDIFQPFAKGFTQNIRLTGSQFQSLPVENRGFLWTNLHSIGSDELFEHKVPFYFNEAVYVDAWTDYMAYLAAQYADGGSYPQFEILTPDIEVAFGALTDEHILYFRDETDYSEHIPSEFLALPDDEFIDLYKREMAYIYHVSAQTILDTGYSGKLGYYLETPIPRTYWEIDDYSWDEWVNEMYTKNYLYFDVNDNGQGFYENWGPFYYAQDIFQPSAYIFYNNSNYLAYQLFQIEANLAVIPDGADVLVWQWNEFHPSTDLANKAIMPHMAHATAIFPFMTGAKGTALWGINLDDYPTAMSENYAQYMYGMYRLSQYKHYFDGDYELVSERNAHEDFTGGHPIWRGVINDARDSLLVAAHNPHANWDAWTQFDIVVNGDLFGIIYTQGKNTELVELPYSDGIGP